MRAPRAPAIIAVILIASSIWAIMLLPGSAEPGAGRMPLLAVSLDDEGNEGTGGVAYLDLRIVEGSGNVYIHSEPLTKVDTQASTTFAQRYACDLADVECDAYDFLYSIESDAPIVGGPSAGAATAALTYAVLTGQPVSQDVAITGTISSGGVIGTVGGVPQKVDAAAREGLSKVIIPYLSDENATENATIETFRAQTLDDIIASLGLEGPGEANATIDVPEAYTDTMREVAQELCEAQRLPITLRNDTYVTGAYERIENLSNDARDAAEAGAYYTQASHCFNVRVQYYYLDLIQATSSLNDDAAAEYAIDTIDANLSAAHEAFDTFEGRIDSFDLNEIQVYSIVDERYRESTVVGGELVEEIERSSDSSAFRERFDEGTLYSIAYVFARIDSMESWMRFSGFEPGPEIDEQQLRRACGKKLSEASELAEYTAYLTGVDALSTAEVYDAYANEEYAVCIYQASLITARAETFLSTIGIEEEELPLLYEAKSRAAYRQIAEQDEFPVMAYSYYEYAQNLLDTNPETSLLYIENALALAELDLYLESGTETFELARYDRLAFVLGMIIASLLALAAIAATSQSPTKKREK